MRILFLCPRYPYPPTRGDQVRSFHLIKGLARHAAVTVACFGDGPPLPVDGLRVRTVPLRGGARLTENLRRPDPRLPIQTRLYLDSGMRRLVAAELAELPAVVHLTLARMGPYMPPPGDAHRHLDVMDAMSVNMATRAAATAPFVRAPFTVEAALLRRYEAELVARADSSSLVSAADRKRAPGLERTTVIPNGVDLERLPFREPAESGATLIFFGNLGYFHNVRPAQFVATEVLPRVRRRIPEARLRIVGARPAAAVRRLAELDGVELAADVPEIAAELAGATVAVLPMFSGSGLKNKVLEAFATGLPVVTNSLGIEAIEAARPGRDHLRAEDAEGMAAAAERLLASPGERRSLAREARALVEERYSWERQVDILLGLYRV
jgi:glycosyltransferase involved in cell wall biosynthesis